MSMSLNFAINDEYDRFISLWKQLVEISILIYWESFRSLLSDYPFFSASTKIHKTGILGISLCGDTLLMLSVITFPSAQHFSPRGWPRSMSCLKGYPLRNCFWVHAGFYLCYWSGPDGRVSVGVLGDEGMSKGRRLPFFGAADIIRGTSWQQ